MDNAEEIMHTLEEFSKLKPKDIPRELDDYLGYVAKTGDPVFKWSIIKCLFREKMLNVITDFYESTLTMELPPCPNVDPFNYERMKANLLEKLESFHGAPFTVQRISELLTNPRKEYNRADKFMRAIEKNILVVSIREPGRFADTETDSAPETSFNGIPESNESSIESSFGCNDLADPDSSSQPYEQHSSFQTAVQANGIPSLAFKGSNINPDDNLDIVNASKNVVTEITVCTEKDSNETVICSTVTLQAGDVLLDDVKESSVEEKPIVLDDNGNPCESIAEVVDANSTEFTSESKEAAPIEVVVEEVPTPELEVDSKPDSNIADNNDSTESMVISTSSNESNEDEINESNEDETNEINESNEDETNEINESNDDSSESVQVEECLEENEPVECDTSNVFDCEAVNSSEVEELKDPLKVDSPEVDTTETNEADSNEDSNTPTCDKETEQACQDNVETDATTSTEDMEIGECQISLVDQSDS